jgi:L-ribulose-5-phosphate 4-epimerase
MTINLQEVSELTLDQNIKLHQLGLVIDTFGNASAKIGNTIIIKPSGVILTGKISCEMSIVEFDSKKCINGINPSSDTPTHLELYRAYDSIKGITHTHSCYATAWAQASRSIPCLGTTHADYWKGDIPVTRTLTIDEIKGDYELETGKVIVETLQKLELEPSECPGILVAHHGPFTWGKTIEEAVKNAERLEYIARLAWTTLQLNSQTINIPSELLHRHFSRKHGPKAYYGQKSV